MRIAGQTGMHHLKGMTSDGSGNIYMVGHFEGTIDLDPGPGTLIRNSSSFDVWFGKYSSTGNLIWAHALNGLFKDEKGTDVAVDNAGNVYITGFIQSESTVDFNPGAGVATPPTNSPQSMFVAKYNSTGTFQWVRFGGSNLILETKASAIAVDGSGNVLRCRNNFIFSIRECNF